MTIENAIELLTIESLRFEAEAKNLALKIVTQENANTPDNKHICQELKFRADCYAKAVDKITA